jgi:hypothetical protein
MTNSTHNTWTCKFQCSNCGHQWEALVIKGHIIEEKSRLLGGCFVRGPNGFFDVVVCPNCKCSDNVFRPWQ